LMQATDEPSVDIEPRQLWFWRTDLTRMHTGDKALVFTGVPVGVPEPALLGACGAMRHDYR
jgi:hypothetical protein